MKKFSLIALILCSFLQINAQTCPGLGSINYKRWNSITGTSVTNLTSNSKYPNSPSVTGTLTIFQIPVNSGSTNYGMRVYGYICPPTTGNYVFWISADDASELWLSTSADSTKKTKIAYNTSATSSLQWTKYSTQKSATKALVAGTKYYIEALMKQGTGSDNLAVGWSLPGASTSAPSQVIPGTALSTNSSMTVDNTAPTAPTALSVSNITNTSLTLKWTASTDNIKVTGYDVYVNSVKKNTINVSSNAYSVTGLTPNTAYAIYVKAKDSAGNQSANSSTYNAVTLAATAVAEKFTVRTVIANQRMPHDLFYGPDGNIWYTERFAGTVSFVNPTSGAKKVVLTLGSKFIQFYGQDGLLGLALHPQFKQCMPYVYISYTYSKIDSTHRLTRIERYQYDSVNQALISPVTVLENIPGSNDHNSGRIAIGPDLKLYYTVGDMGAGQFANLTRTENAQNLNVYEGKVLRLNTDPVAGSWIPTDNPFSNAGVITAVYTYGHRNPQGLVWGNVNGLDRLYSSEHGPYSDDEINVIEVGRNYGWPQVSGYCDGNYNGNVIGTFSVVDEVANCAALNAREPLRSIFPAEVPPTGGDNMTWPSVAPSGTEFYGSTAIPGWQNSLLVACLKAGHIARYQLSSDGLSIISDTINYFQGLGRFRDVVVSPDGLKLYVACDSSGSTSGPTQNVTTTPANPGSILEFTYTGALLQSILKKQEIVLPNNKTLDIYPNPANQYVVVYNYALNKKRTASLYDMNGRAMRQIDLSQTANKINVSNLSSGLYILRVTDATQGIIRTEKIVITH